MLPFLKLNGVSALYAISFLIQVQLMVNVYRIERITGLSNIAGYADILIIIVFLFFSILCYFLTKHLFGRKKLKYIIPVLWMPYFWMFNSIFVSLYPITDPGEKPLPAIGIVIMGHYIFSTFVIILINIFSSLRSRE